MLEIINLGYRLKGEILLEGISAKFESGLISGIIGSNGAGKSTLLKIISGENKSTDGFVRLNGKLVDNYHYSFPASMRAVVNQHELISSDISVIEYVLLGRLVHNTGRYTVSDYQSVGHALEITSTTGLAGKSLLALSGGERQRVQLARALSQLDYEGNGSYSGYLFLDEFSANMDIYYQQQMLRLLKKLCMSRRFAIIIIGHDLNQVINYFDYCILLKQGKLQASGSPKQVLSRGNIQRAYGVSVNEISHEGKKYFVF